jgi:ribosomal protein S18 acetylase RimI-like enzyme
MDAGRLTVRQAAQSERDTLRDLYRAFVREVPEPDYVDFDLDRELSEVDEYVDRHLALLAESDGAAVGFALARMRGARHGWISDLYVVPGHRRGGVAAELVREAASRLREHGAEVVELDVRPWNVEARAAYERWGFRESSLTLFASAADLEARLSRSSSTPSHGLVFVQTDDESKVEEVVRSFLPRLGQSPRTDVHPPANGWIAVDDELCSADPQLLRRLAQELSYRTAGVVLTLGVEESAVVRYVLFERGSIADEYASVPEYHGPLPSGDVVALGANPTVTHRLTGASAEQVRAVARTAGSVSELPPPEDLYREIAQTLGVPLP